MVFLIFFSVFKNLKFCHYFLDQIDFTKIKFTGTSKTVSRRINTLNRPRTSFHLSSNSHLIPSHSRGVNSSIHSKSINTRVYISSRSSALHRSSANNIRRKAAMRRNQNFSRISNRLAERPRSPILKSSYNHSYSAQKTSQHHNNSAKMSSWERNEMIRLMRKKDEEYRKKEEELKFQRERERMRFERERLEKEKLEVQQMKLTAQLASAQMAFLPQSSHQSLSSVVVPDITSTSSDRNRNSKTSKHSSLVERRSR